MDFPNIQRPDYKMKERSEDTSIISKFEDGSQQSRTKFTRSRRIWELEWKLLPNTDHQTLITFIRTQAKFSAVAFFWTNPVSNERVEVRITDVKDFTYDIPNYWSGGLTLTEV